MREEFLREFHPLHKRWVNIGLGPDRGLYGEPFKRKADAIVDTGNELILYEFKLRLSPGSVGQMELYAQLLPDTPILQAVLDKPRRLVIVAGQLAPDIVAFANAKGIEVKLYDPLWVLQYLKDKDTR